MLAVAGSGGESRDFREFVTSRRGAGERRVVPKLFRRGAPIAVATGLMPHRIGQRTDHDPVLGTWRC